MPEQKQAREKKPRCVVDRDQDPWVIHINNNKAAWQFPAVEGVIALENFNGAIIDYGSIKGLAPDLRVVCLRERADGELCGSIFKNAIKNIRSHNSDLHKDGSQYSNKQNKESIYRCDELFCSYERPGFNAFLAHKNRHGWRGDCDDLLKFAVRSEQAPVANSRSNAQNEVVGDEMDVEMEQQPQH